MLQESCNAALALATTGFEQSKIYFRRSTAREGLQRVSEAFKDMLYAADAYGDELMNEEEAADPLQMVRLSSEVCSEQCVQ